MIPLLIKSYCEYIQRHFDLKSWRRKKTLSGETSGRDTQPATSVTLIGTYQRIG